ncbi:sugar-binding transcriptional regulator [Ollibium composti]|jgi:DNA-binding transcriptional regulator LsrR (DeoR family)|uniref:Sugar-binding transcriptional regulator n=1 Tax=Ollibium composti TaxID=2675109 RepID=A0ABY2QB49_9HYPH|nr:sugar-binding transcriptional regulator [Mesorhizobium composti]THF58908.1 sugar-binding transcriptional regulator [Mesorhizobium composti]
MNARQEGGSGHSRLDDAARAGWLYYVAGNTQDQIAAKLGISRQTAQRLVSLAVSEGLVKVRLDHPIAACLDLAAQLRSRFALDLVEVVPSDPGSSSTTIGVAEAAAAEIERWLRKPEPIVLAIGTGRTLKAAIEQLPPMECPQHKVVSLTGNISPDGSAAFYNVIFTMADRIKARSFPMPLPVIASSPQEREMLLGQPMIQPTLDLAARADVTFVGIGDLGPQAPLYEDGFVSESELKALHKAGGIAEIVGWVFDREGRLIEGITNDRVSSAPLPSREKSLVVALAMGEKKLPGILAAVNRRLVNGLITDERTASALLSA